MTEPARPLPRDSVRGVVALVEDVKAEGRIDVWLEGVEVPVSFTTGEHFEPTLAERFDPALTKRARSLEAGAAVVMEFSYLGPKESPMFLGRSIKDDPG